MLTATTEEQARKMIETRGYRVGQVVTLSDRTYVNSIESDRGCYGQPMIEVLVMSRGRDVGALCAQYNDATCPWTMRTDHAHHRCYQRARAIIGRLRRMGAIYHETESGRLMVGRRER
jgi:hypothetical protein